MKQSIKNEFFKITHQKITWIAPILILCLMMLSRAFIGNSEQRLLIMATYNSGEWILLALIIVCSTVLSMEYQYHTILLTIYKAPNRFQVFASKLLVISIYNLFLHFLAIIFTLLLQLTPLKAHVSWLIINKYSQSLVINMLNTILIDLVASTLIVSLIFLSSSLIKSNSIVITINLAIVFMGQTASSQLLNTNAHLLNLVKWNPLNMYNLTAQYYNHAVYHDTSHLTNIELLLGTLIYTAIFLILGYYLFRKKKF